MFASSIAFKLEIPYYDEITYDFMIPILLGTDIADIFNTIFVCRTVEELKGDTMNKQKIWILVAAFAQLLIFTVCSYAATPTISTVSGSISNGQTISITGTNMMQDQTSTWTSFFSGNANASGFEGSSPSSDGYIIDGDGSYVTSPKLSGSRALQIRDQGSGEVTGGAKFYPGSSISDMYFREYVMFHEANHYWPSAYFKHFWFGEPGATNCFLVQPNAGSGPGSWLEGFPADGGTDFNFPAGFTWDKWYCLEVHFNNSTKLVEIWLDNQLIHTKTASYSVTTADYMEIGGVNLNGLPSNGDMRVYVDNAAVKSGSRVYPSSVITISNSATYGSGTMIYQTPVFISDTSVQVNLNLTGLGSGPYYLWVTNNSQARSSAYQLGSGTTDPTPPSTPTGVSVQIVP